MRRAALILPIFLLLATAASAASPDPGTMERLSYSSPLGTEHYLLYTPASVNRFRPAPLLVMTHGCNTTALQQAAASLYNPIAEREHFLVLYPDNDDLVHPVQCWRFYDPTSWMRGGTGDPAIVAGMTRAVMASHDVDPERVYAIGMSSGALITTDLGATYPDIYAAVGTMAGGPYSGSDCVAGLHMENVGQLAQGAFVAEGLNARVMPFLVLYGDADHTVTPECGAQTAEQWLRDDNLVTSSSQDGPLKLSPARHVTRTKPGGRTYDVYTYVDPAGCVIGRRYVIHGMDHFWSGGSTDPKLKSFTDPSGPSAAEASWAFFKHYRLSDTDLPCAETKTPSYRHRGV